jgi:hypothetical protein
LALRTREITLEGTGNRSGSEVRPSSLKFELPELGNSDSGAVENRLSWCQCSHLALARGE